jgi:hypothetical protein
MRLQGGNLLHDRLRDELFERCRILLDALLRFRHHGRRKAEHVIADGSHVSFLSSSPGRQMSIPDGIARSSSCR